VALRGQPARVLVAGVRGLDRRARGAGRVELGMTFEEEATKKAAARLVGDRRQQPKTWAEFMKQAHERPLPRAVLDDLAVTEQRETEPSGDQSVNGDPRAGSR
jgi:hypothetical protein